MSEFHRALELLADLKHPLFVRMYAEKRPLPMALGIAKTVLNQSDALRHRAIKNSIKSLTNSPQYLDALKAEGAKRYDLAGNPVGPVSSDHQTAARERLKIMHRRKHPPQPKG
jgi:sRNA-binding protein